MSSDGIEKADQQPLPVEEKKKKVVKIDVEDPDAALYKVHGKYATEEEKRVAFAPRPQGSSAPPSWEIDPSKLSLSQKLGQGTFGTVHRGNYSGMDVAVKLLNWDEAVLDPVQVSYHKTKFLREVDIMSQLSHPNITRFVGAWAGGGAYQIPSTHLGNRGIYTLKHGTHMLLMEFISGGSLRALWINARRAGRRRLGYSVVMQLALDTARGLAYLHSKRICHRDLKPDNILLDDDMKVKIADFGESRVQATPSTDMSKLTGTIGYMAPEVLSGTATTGYDHKCDVFSFGIVVWELYNCNVPFFDLHDAINGRDLAIGMALNGLRPTMPKCIPKFLRDLIVTCWDVDPDRRPEMEQVVRMISNESTANCGICVTSACDSCCAFCDDFTNPPP